MSTTTALSTSETDLLITLLMPAGHAALLRKACYTYSKAKAKAAHATAARAAECEALVHTAIRAKQARLERVPRHKWTSLLQLYYFDKRDATIDEETIRKYVKTFPGFN